MGKRDQRLVALSVVLEIAANAERRPAPEVLRLAARIVRGYDGAKDVLAAYQTGGRPEDWALEATSLADCALREASERAPTPVDPFRVGPNVLDRDEFAGGPLS